MSTWNAARNTPKREWCACGGSAESGDTSTEPYQADNRVDMNGNGIACAKPTDKTFVEDGVTYVIYNFIDDVIR